MIQLQRLIPGRQPYQILPSLLLLALLAVPAALSAETLEAMVNRANAAAEKQDYPTAISLYEQAVKKAPAQATLKKNLAVLYANHGVGLHEQKKDAEAIAYLDKGLALTEPNSREWKNIRESKAGIYFAQAVALKEGAENPTDADFSQMKELLNKALELSPQETAFKKTLAGVYGEEAYLAAQQDNFDKARVYLETALTYDPQSKTLHQSLANVYLGLARQQPDHAQEWVDKATATDNSPKIQETGQRILKTGVSANGAPFGGFASQPNEVKGALPKEASQLSVAEMVADMEAQLQIKPDKGQAITDRLETLEKKVLGKPQTGALATRTKSLYGILMGSYTAGSYAQSNLSLTQAPVANTQNTYLADIFKVTDGKVIRWGKFPLRVYFQDPKNNELYKPEYKQAVLDGFTTWKTQTNGFVNFIEVKNEKAADILVNWGNQYIDRFADPENAPDIYKNFTPPKRTKLMTAVQMASMLTPGYFSIAPQAVNAAMQYQVNKKLQMLQDESKISIGLTPTQSLPMPAAKILIQNMAAKEFGHALGLKGNSSQAGDLLYPELRSDTPQLPTIRDLATLREIYDRPPNILLNVH
jgi:predicted Zn-dependent protease/Tfp pilus assembly protein PilF